ncbi:hypothetical protein SKPI104516_12390 [Skermania piniformis]
MIEGIVVARPAGTQHYLEARPGLYMEPLHCLAERTPVGILKDFVIRVDEYDRWAIPVDPVAQQLTL